MSRKRLTKEQQQDITRQMLEESRTLTEQGVPLREIRQRVAERRNDLVQAACEGLLLMVVPVYLSVKPAASTESDDD